MTHKHRDLLQKKNVIGVVTNPKGETVVFVKRKEDEANLSDEDVVPKELDGKQTHVEQQDFELEDAYDPTNHPFPIRQNGAFMPRAGGIEVQGEQSKGVGTIGSPLLELDGTYYVLTNEHVIDPTEVGEPVYHPRKDGGEKIGVVAARTEVYKNPQEQEEAAPLDAALIEVDKPENWLEHMLGTPEPTDFADPEKYDRVYKSGRTTGYTAGGLIFGTDGDVKIKTGETEDGDDIRVEFSPILTSTLTTAGGDSGSVWVNEKDDTIAGIHFAGGGGIAAALPASAVRDEFGELELATSPDDEAQRHLLRRVFRKLRNWRGPQAE